MSNPDKMEVMSEVLTKTQRKFVDFVTSKVKPVERVLKTGYDVREAHFTFEAPPQLVPVDRLIVGSMVSVEKVEEIFDDETPAPPHNSYESHVGSSQPYGIERASIYFNVVSGFELASEGGDITHVSDEVALPHVNALVELERSGVLKAVEEHTT